MKNYAESCFICGGTAFVRRTGDYRSCASCGHETLNSADAIDNIINDLLDRKTLDRKNSLDRFKTSILLHSARTRSLLVDIGSASGRFLYQNRGEFSQSLGIEVTPECVEFSRELGLQIENDLSALDSPVSVLTFWHSLEHIPDSAIESIFSRIREYSTHETVVIVSVPNASSLQSKMLGSRFAYYDVPHHLHQFTPDSLDRLMKKFGFIRTGMHSSFSYSSFGWLQGLLNLFNSRHNYLYYRLKRGWDFGLSPLKRALLDVYNAVVAVILLLPSLLLTFHDLFLASRGGVLTVCYQQEKASI